MTLTRCPSCARRSDWHSWMARCAAEMPATSTPSSATSSSTWRAPPPHARRAHHRIHDERADVGHARRQHAGHERHAGQRQGEGTVGAPHELERAAAVAEHAEEAAQRGRVLRGAEDRLCLARRVHGAGHLGRPLRAGRHGAGDEPRAAPEEHVAVDPGGQHGEAVAKADQHRDVQRHPGEPGEQAAEAQATDLDHRARLADRGHGAEVAVAKRRRRPAARPRTRASISCAT